MSKKKKQGKGKIVETGKKTTKSKVVVTNKEQLQPTNSKTKQTSRKEKLIATKSKAKSAFRNEPQEQIPLLYGKKNFVLILGGIALIALGMLLMAGGGMPSPDVWDESIIYGFRRITLAPISILLGLAVVLYSIFAPASNNV